MNLTNLLSKSSTLNIDQKIFFLHVPKCGGSSIRNAIENSFNFSSRTKNNNFHLEDTAAVSAANTLEKPIIEYKRDFLNYCMAHKSYRYISGHFAYSEKAMQAYGDQWKHVTLLRDPVAKWFSQYFYNRHKQKDHYKLDCSLEDFLKTDGAVRLGRNYSYLLVDGISSEAAATDDAIDQAIKNLEKFSLVGVLEELDWFCEDFQAIFGAKLEIRKYNKSPLSKNKRSQQITDDIRAQVEEICQPNMRVYNAAIELIKKSRKISVCA